MEIRELVMMLEERVNKKMEELAQLDRDHQIARSDVMRELRQLEQLVHKHVSPVVAVHTPSEDK